LAKALVMHSRADKGEAAHGTGEASGLRRQEFAWSADAA